METTSQQRLTLTQTRAMRSPQQQAAVDWALNGAGSLNLIARAGTGKSWTIKEVVKEIAEAHMEGAGGIFLGAYNVPIAAELAAWLVEEGIKFPKAVAKTMHSAAMAAWKKVASKNLLVEPKKINKIFDARFPSADPDNTFSKDHPARAYQAFVLKAVSLAKQRAFGVLCELEDRKAWFDMVDHFGLDEDLEDGQDAGYGIERALEVLKRSIELDREVIDYDDMILAPLLHKARFWQYDWVIIDEAQDTNPARRALALAMLRPGGRAMMVGDPAQAIYGFTGADSDAMDLVKAELNSAELPLNQTRRCPRAVVALANSWVPDFEALDAAPEGLVRTITEAEFNLEALNRTDAVLCRKTAPLVETAYALIRRGTPCKLEGRTIGEGLLKLAARFKVTTLAALQNKLRDYQTRETAKWLAKGKEQKAADIADQCETLHVIIDQMLEQRKQNVADLVAFVDKLFGDNVQTAGLLTLATVHRSKGREWDRVYLLGRNAYMPSAWARKAWQLQQEDNLCYVAVTRAKRELVEVLVDTKKKPAAREGAAAGEDQTMEVNY